MLAVLQIRMEWTKDSRTPRGSAIRREYYKPVKIENDVYLSGEGIFLKTCNYYQQNEIVVNAKERIKRYKQRQNKKTSGMPFTASEENEQRRLQRCENQIRKEKGAFYPPEKIQIPCVEIKEEADSVYRVKWSDSLHGKPKRCGGNEDLYRKGTKLCGRVHTCNETAFLLKEKEAGILKYNYRFTGYEGQWYECYYVYLVNTDTLYTDVFLRDYDFIYDKLADLF